jgi:Cu-Zn family superoxide dismutase
MFRQGMFRQGMVRQTAGGLPAGLVRLGGARRGVRLPVVAAAAVLAAGCASGQPAAPASPTPAPAPSATAPVAAATTSGGGGGIEAEGVLAAPDRATTAFTYNPALAPEGARIEVESGGRGGSTEIRLDVDGLLPNRGYAAHAHVNACGPTGDAAGPHFQNQVDPAAAPGKPSTDPAYANPQNEIWLDLRTDGNGDGESRAEVPFVFSGRAPASVIIHEAEATGTAPGQAGSAGARLACITVPFR